MRVIRCEFMLEHQLNDCFLCVAGNNGVYHLMLYFNNTYQ